MKYINEFGVIVTVKSEKDAFLFLDGIDRDRYISELIKNTDEKAENAVRPLIAGLNSNSVIIVFDGGSEEKLRYIIRKVHLSYSAYRRNKKCPVRFKSSSFVLVDDALKLQKAVKTVKEESDYICTKFGRINVNRNI